MKVPTTPLPAHRPHRGLPFRAMLAASPAALATLLAGWCACVVTLADTVHLKNGATIACDSIEERGAELLLRQKSGVIVVPRSDVARIERAAVPPGGGQAPPSGSQGSPGTRQAPSGSVPGPVTRPSPVTVAQPAPAASSPADEERRLADLRARLADRGVVDDASRREIVVLLVNTGGRALSERRFDDARRRFEEALRHDAAEDNARRGLALSLLGLGQTAQARSFVERALLEAPLDADLHRIHGEVLARENRGAEAIAALEKSYALHPDPGLRGRIDELRRQNGVDADYRRAEAAHFTVAYDRVVTSPVLEAEIIPYLEGQFPELVRLFDFVPKEPITVVVYPEEGFRHATLADAAVAGLYDGKVRVPSGGLRRLDAFSRAVLTHELAHAFIAGKSAGGAPRWLHEGLAQWAEGKRSSAGTETGLARAYRDARDRSALGSTFTYATALSFVEYLLDRYGQSSLNQVLAEIGRGVDPETALDTVTRDSMPELQAAWGDDLIRRRLP